MMTKQENILVMVIFCLTGCFLTEEKKLQPQKCGGGLGQKLLCMKKGGNGVG